MFFIVFIVKFYYFSSPVNWCCTFVSVTSRFCTQRFLPKEQTKVNQESPRQVKSYSAYQRSFYGAFTRHILVFTTEDKRVFKRTHPAERPVAVSSIRVVSWEEEGKKCEDERYGSSLQVVWIQGRSSKFGRKRPVQRFRSMDRRKGEPGIGNQLNKKFNVSICLFLS